MSTLSIILLVLIVLAFAGGGWGYSRVGYAGFGPVGLLILVGVVLLLTGNLHIR